VGAAFTVAAHLRAGGHPALGGALHHAAAHAFTHGLSIGCLVAATVSAAGALAAALLLPAQPPRASHELAALTRSPEPVAALD
jgi:hypothetical protein